MDLSFVTIEPVWCSINNGVVTYIKAYEENYVLTNKNFIGLEKATQQDFKNNWVYTHFYTDKVFSKKTPYYVPVKESNMSAAFRNLKTFATQNLMTSVCKHVSLDDDFEQEDPVA